jgi:hypothetical protein
MYYFAGFLRALLLPQLLQIGELVRDSYLYINVDCLYNLGILDENQRDGQT